MGKIRQVKTSQSKANNPLSKSKQAELRTGRSLATDPPRKINPEHSTVITHHLENISLSPSPTPSSLFQPKLQPLVTAYTHSPNNLIQRFDEESPGPLTPTQVIQAKNWYAAKKQQYTPEIIKQIQAKVGVTQTGEINSETVQAVALWQQSNPPLKVDGMAGPRTLPAAFASGLAEEKSINQYVGAAKTIQTQWATLKTPQARASALIKVVNERLSAAGVPICNQALKDLGAAAGQLSFETWTIDLGKEAFSKATLTDAEAAEIADTVYHEARHAEQWYRMAQMLAGKGRSAKAIARETGIKAEVVATAVSNPLKPGSMEALIAEGWHESVYGARAAYREQVLTEVLASKTALNKAQETYNKSPTKTNQAKLDAAQKDLILLMLNM